MTAVETHEGRCLCGRVRFRAAGAPKWVTHCHCESCRRATASPMTTYAGYETDAVVWTGDALATYASSTDVTRRFCGQCGTPMSYDSDRWPGEVHLFVATMDDPNSFAPGRHVYAVEKLAWMHLADYLPQYVETSGRKIDC